MPAVSADEPPREPGQPILSPDEADRRLRRLAQLQASLTGRGVRCLLARRHRLVLLSNGGGRSGPSGLTNPQLHIFLDDGTRVATTDGTRYLLDGSQRSSGGDPLAAADHILRRVAGDSTVAIGPS